jgi:hypothetical protein
MSIVERAMDGLEHTLKRDTVIWRISPLLCKRPRKESLKLRP